MSFKPLKTYIVTRHSATKIWIQQQLQVGRIVAHLDIDVIQPGDHVIGILPINLAAAICQRGAIYFHLCLDVPPVWRGKELQLEEFIQWHPRIQQFHITSGRVLDEKETL